jgi:UDP-N-acetylglucosamine 2-epimerase
LTLTQKEAYFAKVPCITLDTVTAWPETVEDGWNMVVGKENDRQQIQRENIIDAVSLLSQMKNNLIYLVTGRQQK